MKVSDSRGCTPLTTLVVFNDKITSWSDKKEYESVAVSFGNAADMQVVEFNVTRDEARLLVEALNTCIARDYDRNEEQTVCVLTDWLRVTDRDGEDALCCDLCQRLYPTGELREPGSGLYPTGQLPKPASCPQCQATTRTSRF